MICLKSRLRFVSMWQTTNERRFGLATLANFTFFPTGGDAVNPVKGKLETKCLHYSTSLWGIIRGDSVRKIISEKISPYCLFTLRPPKKAEKRKNTLPRVGTEPISLLPPFARSCSWSGTCRGILSTAAALSARRSENKIWYLKLICEVERFSYDANHQFVLQIVP